MLLVKDTQQNILPRVKRLDQGQPLSVNLGVTHDIPGKRENLTIGPLTALALAAAFLLADLFATGCHEA